MPNRLVVIGDSTGAGLGIPPGNSMVDIVTRELRGKGVEVENWSNAGATAVGCLRQLPMIRRRLCECMEQSDHLYVLVQLGNNDRLLGVHHHDITKALDEMVHMILHTHATPVLLELIPDGIEHHLHKHWEEKTPPRHVPLIQCPNPMRGAYVRPHKVTGRYLPEGEMPMMANQNFLQPDMINYNVQAHQLIAKQCLHSLGKLMHHTHSLGAGGLFAIDGTEDGNSSDEDGMDCVLM